MTSSNRLGRVLIAEDEFLLGVLLEENLRESGYDVAGPIGDLPAVLAALETETFDYAIFDINLGGQMVYPAAEVLMKRGVPVALLSGYGNANIPEPFRGVTVLTKPCDFRHIQAWLEGAKASLKTR